MPVGPNLFARLHKWAARQDENFLTESLAVVLEQLLILAPEVATRLINQLTGGFLDVPPAESTSIEIRPQVETGQGRPDLEISTPSHLVWVEVKAESDLRTGQLEGYRVLMSTSGTESHRLILLTRYPETYPSDAARPDLEVRWFEVADWLETECDAAEAAGPVAAFVLRQFLDFLRVRGMRLEQVGKYLPDGVRALYNLMDMLLEAGAACKVSVKKSVGWGYIGVSLDGPKYWVGVSFKEPEHLRFATAGKIDREAAVQLGVGEVREESWVPGRWRWIRKAELESEPVHFFARTKVGQMRWLEAFLRECLVHARSIETPDQPPIPDEPEGA